MSPELRARLRDISKELSRDINSISHAVCVIFADCTIGELELILSHVETSTASAARTMTLLNATLENWE